MSTFRFKVIVLYVFLVTIAVVLVVFTWTSVTNPFFGMSFTSAPAGFDIGIQYFLLLLAIIGAASSLASCGGLVQRRRWSPSLVKTIAWFTLFFYPGISLLTYVMVTTMGKVRVPFFVMFDYKTALLTVLSIAALAVLRSKQWTAAYAASASLKRHAPQL